MCARYVRETPAAELAELFGVMSLPALDSSWNTAPTQNVLAIRAAPEGGQREGVLLRWGLIPSWAKDPSIGSQMFNARGETAREKPSFRSAFKKRRCLLPADGFYEWKKGPPPRQPFYFHMKDGKAFAFAGLFERWESQDGTAIESCTMLTTTPNELVAAVHDRMPVIVSPNQYSAWLDPSDADMDSLQALVAPFPADRMDGHPVSRAVGNVRKNEPGLMSPEAAS
jgi:putative SOS response-associated peptidase YedK